MNWHEILWLARELDQIVEEAERFVTALTVLRAD